eukprot:TRINITY_DN9506_c0_g1_i1.p1 TRINITY_DN9506_c0_g1~~TRINITY_DN9506_c0_g1_i1.p1  ORF type:complete len:512 (-),score=111.78 TRINITY_DN9506_c0_g1_i1:713-2104(-)
MVRSGSLAKMINPSLVNPSVPNLLPPTTEIAKYYNNEEKQNVWLQFELKKRSAEFTEIEHETIWLTTYNVNNKRPLLVDFSDWFNFPDQPAIVVIGLQEMDMSAEALLLQEMASRSEPWEQVFAQYLNKKGKYHHVTTKQLCGILLCVYIREDCKPYCSGGTDAICPTGIMGIMGNKGGVAARLSLHESSFCFITSHFNAFQNNVERRNQDFQDIHKGLLFNLSPTSPPIGLKEHDNLYWLGDLNYRIDLEDLVVRAKIKEQKYDELYENDQLRVQRAASKVFNGWMEGPINFAPTYKYDSGCDEYDTSEKHRIPAWTDRILYKSTDSKLLSYGRHELTLSDHRPVSALFNVVIKKVIPHKKEKVLRELAKQLEDIINNGKPEPVLSTTSCHFPELIQYGKEATFTISIENVGKVGAEWEFKAKNEEMIVSKPWLSMYPMKGWIESGDKADVEFTILVDKSIF